MTVTYTQDAAAADLALLSAMPEGDGWQDLTGQPLLAAAASGPACPPKGRTPYRAAAGAVAVRLLGQRRAADRAAGRNLPDGPAKRQLGRVERPGPGPDRLAGRPRRDRPDAERQCLHAARPGPGSRGRPAGRVCGARRRARRGLERRGPDRRAAGRRGRAHRYGPDRPAERRVQRPDAGAGERRLRRRHPGRRGQRPGRAGRRCLCGPAWPT